MRSAVGLAEAPLCEPRPAGLQGRELSIYRGQLKTGWLVKELACVRVGAPLPATLSEAQIESPDEMEKCSCPLAASASAAMALYRRMRCAQDVAAAELATPLSWRPPWSSPLSSTPSSGRPQSRSLRLQLANQLQTCDRAEDGRAPNVLHLYQARTVRIACWPVAVLRGDAPPPSVAA